MCHVSYKCVNYVIKETNKICAHKIEASAEADQCEKSNGDDSTNYSEHHHDNQHEQGQHLHLADAGEEGGDEAGL